MERCRRVAESKTGFWVCVLIAFACGAFEAWAVFHVSQPSPLERELMADFRGASLISIASTPILTAHVLHQSSQYKTRFFLGSPTCPAPAPTQPINIPPLSETLKPSPPPNPADNEAATPQCPCPTGFTGPACRVTCSVAGCCHGQVAQRCIDYFRKVLGCSEGTETAEIPSSHRLNVAKCNAHLPCVLEAISQDCQLQISADSSTLTIPPPNPESDPEAGFISQILSSFALNKNTNTHQHSKHQHHEHDPYRHIRSHLTDMLLAYPTALNEESHPGRALFTDALQEWISAQTALITLNRTLSRIHIPAPVRSLMDRNTHILEQAASKGLGLAAHAHTLVDQAEQADTVHVVYDVVHEWVYKPLCYPDEKGQNIGTFHFICVALVMVAIETIVHLRPVSALVHISTIAFTRLLRATVFLTTRLPLVNRSCRLVYTGAVTERGGCGDLLYSGHATFLTIFCLVIWSNCGVHFPVAIKVILTLACVHNLTMSVIERFHYTADVLIGVHMTLLVYACVTRALLSPSFGPTLAGATSAHDATLPARWAVVGFLVLGVMTGTLVGNDGTWGLIGMALGLLALGVSHIAATLCGFTISQRVLAGTVFEIRMAKPLPAID